MAETKSTKKQLTGLISKHKNDKTNHFKDIQILKHFNNMMNCSAGSTLARFHSVINSLSAKQTNLQRPGIYGIKFRAKQTDLVGVWRIYHRSPRPFLWTAAAEMN